MRTCVAALCVAVALTPATALAQDLPAPAVERYEGCRTAAAEGNRRIVEICGVVDSAHRSLRTYTRSRHGPQYAETQTAMSSALYVVGVTTHDTQALRDAVQAAREAAEHYERRRPTRWAMLRLQMGRAMLMLAQLGDDEARQQALPVIRTAAETIDRQDQPEMWASGQETLASAYRAHGQDQASLEAAAAALRGALEIYRRPRFEGRRAETEARLAEVMQQLGATAPDPA